MESISANVAGPASSRVKPARALVGARIPRSPTSSPSSTTRTHLHEDRASLQAAFRVTFEQVPNSIAIAYVYYRERPEGAPPPRTKRISPDVNVDFDHLGAVLWNRAHWRRCGKHRDRAPIRCIARFSIPPRSSRQSRGAMIIVAARLAIGIPRRRSLQLLIRSLGTVIHWPLTGHAVRPLRAFRKHQRGRRHEMLRRSR